jgi:hypothetical protein
VYSQPLVAKSYLKSVLRPSLPPTTSRSSHPEETGQKAGLFHLGATLVFWGVLAENLIRRLGAKSESVNGSGPVSMSSRRV